MAESPQEKPIGMTAKPTKPQEFYDNIKRKFAEERDLRLGYRPEGTAQYTSDLIGELSRYEVDPYGGEVTPREPINDTVEVLFIGGGFSALLTSARLRERGVESIRIVERGAESRQTISQIRLSTRPRLPRQRFRSWTESCPCTAIIGRQTSSTSTGDLIRPLYVDLGLSREDFPR